MEAFIVRPFGIQSGIDFDRVERELIIPALARAGIFGSTTATIMEAGNIREDMFQKLLTADIVVADLSIHNSHVFYDLGIRHALRDKRTYLIRCSKDEIPFDLKTERYLEYSEADPAATVSLLSAGLRETVNSDRQDSPVFLLLPQPEASDHGKFLAIPVDFSEELELARAGGQTGKLSLLATETEGNSWQLPALRIIGEVQYRLDALEDAKTTWESIRNWNLYDPQANNRLATIYQRLSGAVIKNNRILFTGHMLDSPDRQVPRFPPSVEPAAREAILIEVAALKERAGSLATGIASGACGSDILFHEVCEELGIPTELYLPFTRVKFLETSVQFGGERWVERFNRLYNKLPAYELSESQELPRWLQKKEGYDIWQRNNLWMLGSALASGAESMTLIALWNGEEGDNSGGTEHLIRACRRRGAIANIIDSRKLLANW